MNFAHLARNAEPMCVHGSRQRRAARTSSSTPAVTPIEKLNRSRRDAVGARIVAGIHPVTATDRTQSAGPRPARRGPPPRPRARRPPSPDPARRCRLRNHTHRVVRRRPDRRRLPTRLQRRHQPLPKRRPLCPLNATAPVEASSGPTIGTAQPTRQGQLNHADPHDRRHPSRQRHTGQAPTTGATGRRPQPQRSDARAETTHQRRRPPPAHHRQSPLIQWAREDTRERLQWPA